MALFSIQMLKLDNLFEGVILSFLAIPFTQWYLLDFLSVSKYIWMLMVYLSQYLAYFYYTIFTVSVIINIIGFFNIYLDYITNLLFTDSFCLLASKSDDLHADCQIIDHYECINGSFGMFCLGIAKNKYRIFTH